MARRTAQTRQILHQQLPIAGPEREALRQKGQFWTPDWVARAMVGYVLQCGTNHIFDPAVGAGAFFRAAKVVSERLGNDIQLLGAEVDPAAIDQAAKTGLHESDLAEVEMRNFVLHPSARRYEAIVANPPYIRHHRLSSVEKSELKAYSQQLIGEAIDGRAGLHVYFLLRALELLKENGRLAFILPADICEGKFAPMLWKWIAENFCLDAVITFAPEATPFPSVDTNALIFLIRNAPPQRTLRWARCTVANTNALTEWTLSRFANTSDSAIEVQERQLDEALRTGLSRPPITETEQRPEVPLTTFAYVLRGIATGDNDFFFLTSRQAQELGIPNEYLRLAVGRTRDVTADEVTMETVEVLDAAGRPTRLLSLGNHPVSSFPLAVQDYLRYGEDLGLPMKSLIAQRRPWYRMEVRKVPPFLFAYLGRRSTRFIRNTAGVLPLTSFLCVYPRKADPDFVERLWTVLQHPDIIANLRRVAKSYGADAIKVEPRALEQLPIPIAVLEAAGIDMPSTCKQPTLF